MDGMGWMDGWDGFCMGWNRTEWNGMGIEWKMEYNGVQWMEWNGVEWNGMV